MSKLCIPLDVEDVCRKEDKKKAASMNRKPIHKPLQYFIPYIRFRRLGGGLGLAPDPGAFKRPRGRGRIFARYFGEENERTSVCIERRDIFSRARAPDAGSRSRDEPTSATKTKHGQDQQGERKRNL